MELKILVFQLSPPLFLAGFFLFARFVMQRLPIERKHGWRLFCIGGVTAIGGLAIAVYLRQIEIGAAVVMAGAIFAAIGIGKLLLSH
jgi:hypothetical protein